VGQSETDFQLRTRSLFSFASEDRERSGPLWSAFGPLFVRFVCPRALPGSDLHFQWAQGDLGISKLPTMISWRYEVAGGDGAHVVFVPPGGSNQKGTDLEAARKFG
jgi:hypothetical protein